VWESRGKAPLFLTLTLRGHYFSFSRPGHFTPWGIRRRYPSHSRQDGPQTQSGRREEEKCCHDGNRLRVIKPRILMYAPSLNECFVNSTDIEKLFNHPVHMIASHYRREVDIPCAAFLRRTYKGVLHTSQCSQPSQAAAPCWARRRF
jgi:hypothetical protein